MEESPPECVDTEAQVSLDSGTRAGIPVVDIDFGVGTVGWLLTAGMRPRQACSPWLVVVAALVLESPFSGEGRRGARRVRQNRSKAQLQHQRSRLAISW